MNILLSQRIGLDQYGNPIDSLESDYIKYFSSFGLNCFPLSNFTSDVPSAIKHLDINGIVLTGGNNIYEKNDYIKYRNNTESALLESALKNNIPVLGICHGMQFMHCYFGGKLKKAEGHVKVTHPITTYPFKLYDLTNKHQDVLVNSYHNYVLDESTLSSEFEVIARCQGDNTIESIAHKKHPLLAVMWHPERDFLKQDKKFNQDLIRSFTKNL